MSAQLACNDVVLLVVVGNQDAGLRIVMTTDDDGHQPNHDMGKVSAARLNCGLWRLNDSRVYNKSLTATQNQFQFQHAPFQRSALRPQVGASASPGFAAEINHLPTCHQL